MSGYVRIHRSLLGHPAFRNDAEAMAFAWMVAKASWAPVCVRYKDRKLELARGQLAVSQRDMARALDRDKAWIERLWKRLRSEGMVKADTKAGVALLTICNYDNYQAEAGDSKAPRKAEAEAANEAGARQGQGTEQGREEGKKGKRVAKATQSAFPRPDGVDEQPWSDFEAVRKRKGKFWTATSYKRCVDDLTRLANGRHTANDLVTHAAAMGWVGIYLPREEANGHRDERTPGIGRTAAAAAEVFGIGDDRGNDRSAPAAKPRQLRLGSH